jgi:hypothetical protein
VCTCHYRVQISELATFGQLGYTWSSSQNIAQIGWSSNNIVNNPPQAQYEGTFQVQVTSPVLGGNWMTLGQVSYDFRNDAFGNYRHVYAIDCTGNTVASSNLATATGIRLVTPSGSRFDEIEVYSTTAVAGKFLCNPLTDSMMLLVSTVILVTQSMLAQLTLSLPLSLSVSVSG